MMNIIMVRSTDQGIRQRKRRFAVEIRRINITGLLDEHQYGVIKVLASTPIWPIA